MADAPHRRLTDWTTTAGLDGSGLLALVTSGATAEGIHLATLGYEVFVLHGSQASADAADTAAHVHAVVADPVALPPEWTDRFDLVVAEHGHVPAGVVAPQGLLVVFSDGPVEVDGLTHVTTDQLEDGGRRSVWVRLGS